MQDMDGYENKAIRITGGSPPHLVQIIQILIHAGCKRFIHQNLNSNFGRVDAKLFLETFGEVRWVIVTYF